MFPNERMRCYLCSGCLTFVRGKKGAATHRASCLQANLLGYVFFCGATTCEYGLVPDVIRSNFENIHHDHLSYLGGKKVCTFHSRNISHTAMLKFIAMKRQIISNGTVVILPRDHSALSAICKKLMIPQYEPISDIADCVVHLSENVTEELHTPSTTCKLLMDNSSEGRSANITDIVPFVVDIDDSFSEDIHGTSTTRKTIVVNTSEGCSANIKDKGTQIPKKVPRIAGKDLDVLWNQSALPASNNEGCNTYANLSSSPLSIGKWPNDFSDFSPFSTPSLLSVSIPSDIVDSDSTSTTQVTNVPFCSADCFPNTMTQQSIADCLTLLTLACELLQRILKHTS